MTPGVFVVLLISLSETVAQGDTNTTKLKSAFDLLIDIIIDKYPPLQKSSGDPFSTGGFQWDTYHDRIIASSLERLKIIKGHFSNEVSIREPQLYYFEMPVYGTIVFDGLHSLNRSDFSSRIKGLENETLDLQVTFKFGNISGTGNFSGLNRKNELKNYFFEFHGTPAVVQVLFVITKDPSRKSVTFKLIKPPAYNQSLTNINVSLLLEQQTSIAFNRLFNNLYDIIYERVILMPREDPSVDKIVDHVINKMKQGVKEAHLRQGNDYTDRNGTKKLAGYLKSTIYGLKSLTRMSSVKVIKENNGDYDLQTKIKFGNVSGNVTVYGYALNMTFNESFTFTSPPVVVEAFYYLPRNESFQDKSLHFLTKPNYTIQVQKEDFRSGFEKVLEHYSYLMHSMVVSRLLRVTYWEVIHKPNIVTKN